ncbi:MAG: GTP-binding protein, partial [Thermomicrobiales bacterium]
MNQYAASDIRNIGLFSHGGAGKTSLAEAMLFLSKATTRLGRVEDGNTTTDFDPDEVKRQMSISVALAPVEWNGVKLNIVDTPGYADLLGEVASALSVVDTALILLDASAGVEVGTEQVWAMAGKQNVQRILFINKMDRENANYAQSLDSAIDAFGNALAPVQIPIGKEKDFRGIVDLLQNRAFTFDDSGACTEGDPPAEMADEIAGHRQTLVEALAETDEELMMRYLDDEEIGADELLAALRSSVKSGTVVPVFCGSGTTTRGVAQLLRGLSDFALPASDRVITGTENGEPVELSADPAGPLAAKVFKTFADPHVGRLSYFRVFSGSLKSNGTVRNPGSDKSERLGHVFYIRGKDHLNTEVVS